MKKIILILIGIVIVCGLVVFIVLQIMSPASRAPVITESNNPVTQAPAGITQQTPTMQIGTVSGGTIQVKDFEHSPATTKDPINKSQYYIGSHVSEGVTDPTASDNPAYSISYDSVYDSFTIVLMQEPLSTTREEAEQYLMIQLGIPQGQMCAIKYLLTVPYSVDQTYAGQSLGFSFCPGAAQLP